MSERRGPCTIRVAEVDSKHWPEAVSDGLEISCEVCGCRPSFDYIVTDEAWKTVVPPLMRPGAVCLPCFDRMAQRFGVHVSDVLVSIQFTGRFETIVLAPIKAFRFSRTATGAIL